MARYTGRHRWWRPLLGALLVIGGWLLLFLVLDTAAHALGKAAGYPELFDGMLDFGPLRGTVMDLVFIAMVLPLVLLTVRWAGRRPAGTVSSVTGRLRGRWLARCLVAAVPPVTLLAFAVFWLPGDDGGPGGPMAWVGWRPFLVSLAVLAVLVPLQAAAEEYVFRGWLLQAVGQFLHSPWWAVVPQAALFAAAHGWGTPWGFADLLVFGLVTGWLTIRTGGLEAAVALHALNNLLGFGVSAALVGGLTDDGTAADAPWTLAAVDTVATLLYAALVLWLARRHRPAQVSPSVVRPVVPHLFGAHPSAPAPVVLRPAPAAAPPGGADPLTRRPY